MSDNDTNGRGGKRPEAPGDFSERLRRLDTALKKARADDGVGQGPDSNVRATTQGMAQALRLATEFTAGILVGGGVGWFVDWGLGVSPWGLIVFLMLGFAAGVLNILRSAGLAREPGTRGD
jgi:ATP synthase protein I